MTQLEWLVTKKSQNQSASDAQLREAKLALSAGQLDAALAHFESILEEEPEQREALYYLAVCYRQQQDHDRALETLSTLMSAHPDYGRSYQEQGYNFVALKDGVAATTAFEKAVSLNPALLESWRTLHGRYVFLGVSQKIQMAADQIRRLEGIPPALRTVESLLHEGKLFLAEKLCRQFLKEQPHHKEAMRLLAELGTRLQILDEAEFLLESCVEFYPEFDRARYDYVQVLNKRQKYDKSLSEARLLFSSSPKNLLYASAFAAQQEAVGNFEEALFIYEDLLSTQGEFPNMLTSRGHALKTSGRTDEAITSYQRAYRAQPDYGDAYWSLANLKTYRFTDDELALMTEQEAGEEISAGNRIHLCFALGKALEDRGEFEHSFAYYSRGNDLKRLDSGYRSKAMEEELSKQKELFDRDFFLQRDGMGCDDASPIFVLGLPRAGSTLLEQILASHSQIDGTMELANVIGTANRLSGQRQYKAALPYPEILKQLSEEQARQLGEQFIADTQHHRAGGLYFVDKMPNNFRHIPLIQLMLPRAKIIDARRHPMACCFSGFKQLFAEGQEFTYGLEEVGRYYRAYVDIMAHWDSVLPDRILRVQHEDVIEDLSGQVARILDYCELPFEQACVDFHQNERAVRTPSSEQVRQPIYKSGMEQWQHFSDFLAPLEQALGPALTNYR